MMLFLFVVGCSSAEKRPAESNEHLSVAEKVEEGNTQPEPSYGPERAPEQPLVVILGPGLARAYASVGVLQALEEARIPIKAVVGTEMGALIGAIYATSSNLNDFEWQLMKLKEEVFQKDRSGLSRLFRGLSRESRLEKSLEKIFGKKTFHKTRVPFRVGLRLDGDLVLVQHGLLKNAVRASMAETGSFGPIQWNGVDAFSTSSLQPFPVDQVKRVFEGPVLVVDVLTRGSAYRENVSSKQEYFLQMKHASRLGATQLSEAEIVLEPNLIGIGFEEFSERTTAIYRGKSAVQERLGEIKELSGIYEDASYMSSRGEKWAENLN